jgi:hypothetical protein
MVVKLETQRLPEGMLLTLKIKNAAALSGNTLENLVNMPSFFGIQTQAKYAPIFA